MWQWTNGVHMLSDSVRLLSFTCPIALCFIFHEAVDYVLWSRGWWAFSHSHSELAHSVVPLSPYRLCQSVRRYHQIFLLKKWQWGIAAAKLKAGKRLPCHYDGVNQPFRNCFLFVFRHCLGEFSQFNVSLCLYNDLLRKLIKMKCFMQWSLRVIFYSALWNKSSYPWNYIGRLVCTKH